MHRRQRVTVQTSTTQKYLPPEGGKSVSVTVVRAGNCIQMYAGTPGGYTPDVNRTAILSDVRVRGHGQTQGALVCLVGCLTCSQHLVHPRDGSAETIARVVTPGYEVANQICFFFLLRSPLISQGFTISGEIFA